MASAAAATASAAVKRPVLTFVTGNKKKLEEVVELLPALFPFQIVSHKVDLPELQGEPEEVSAEKCKLAAEALKGPVLVEDTSLCFNALNGMPGVYIKWFLKKCGHEGLNNLLHAYDDKTGYAQCVFSFSPGLGAAPTTFVGRCPGTIVPARGPTDFGWDPIFQPEGYEQTYAEMGSGEKKNISHRARSLKKLLDYLQENEEAVKAAIATCEAAATTTADEKK